MNCSLFSLQTQSFIQANDLPFLIYGLGTPGQDTTLSTGLETSIGGGSVRSDGVPGLYLSVFFTESVEIPFDKAIFYLKHNITPEVLVLKSFHNLKERAITRSLIDVATGNLLRPDIQGVRDLTLGLGSPCDAELDGSRSVTFYPISICVLDKRPDFSNMRKVRVST